MYSWMELGCVLVTSDRIKCRTTRHDFGRLSSSLSYTRARPILVGRHFDGFSLIQRPCCQYIAFYEHTDAYILLSHVQSPRSPHQLLKTSPTATNTPGNEPREEAFVSTVHPMQTTQMIILPMLNTQCFPLVRMILFLPMKLGNKI
jgi:hypothetical protein